MLQGLLSNWGRWTGDEAKDGAINQGLLSAAFSLMGAKGRGLGGHLGQAGMAGMNQFAQVMDQAQQRKYNDLRMKSLQQQMEAAAADRQRQQTLRDLPMQHRVSTNPGEILEGGAPNKAGFDMPGYAQSLMAHDPVAGLNLQQSLKKRNEPVKLGQGDLLLDPTTYKPLASNPKADDDEFGRALRAAGIDPASPRGRQLAAQRLTKMTTHAPASSTNVTYGAPVAGIDAKGNPVYFQPGNKPGAPPQVIPGIQPPKLGDELRSKDIERKTAVQAADDSLRVIDKALSHPGRSTATGLSGTIDPRNYLPGTNAKNFRVLADQLKGKAFLQAFESLKGGGAITEIEGQKATEAMARLNTAQSDDEYMVALRELRGVIAAGRQRLAGGGGATGTWGEQQPGVKFLGFE